MSGLPAFGNVTVTVLRPATVTGPYGQSRLDYDNATPHYLDGCSVQPGSGDTDVELRAGVKAAFVVYGPSDADVTGTDHVKVPGDDAEYAIVQGRPQRWATGLPLDHVMFALEAWEG